MTAPDAATVPTAMERGPQAADLLRALVVSLAEAAKAADASLLVFGDDGRTECVARSGAQPVAESLDPPVVLPVDADGAFRVAIRILGDREPALLRATRAMALFGPCLVQALSLRSAATDAIAAVAQYEQVFRVMTEGALVIGPLGAIATINAAASTMLGLSPAAAVGRSITRVLGDLNGWLLEAIDRVAAEREPTRLDDVEVFLDHDDRWTAFNVSLIPLIGSGGALTGMMVLLQSLDREKALRRALSRYVSSGMADHLLNDRGAAGEGRLEIVTVLFADIRDFTALSESIGAAETVSMLNEYFSFIEDVVANHGGIVDKYIGDAVMTVFGVPEPGTADAINAVTAALDMVRVLAILNARRAAEGKPAIRTGIGLATGRVVTGNIGSARRMDFTVIGDAVNLASRIEGMTKEYGADILMDGETAARVAGHGVALRRVDRVRVKGQEAPTDIFQASSGAGVPPADGWRNDYEAALRSYLDGRWFKAHRAFERVAAADPEDGTARMMALRCAGRDMRPNESWDGVTRLDRK